MVPKVGKLIPPAGGPTPDIDVPLLFYPSVSGNDGIVWYLRIQEEHLGTVVVLRLEGRVSHATSGDLAEALARFCTPDHRALVLDLSAVDYINGEGLRVIEAAAARHRTMHAELIVCGLSPIVRTAFDLAGAIVQLSVEPSREVALRRVSTDAGYLSQDG